VEVNPEPEEFGRAIEPFGYHHWTPPNGRRRRRVWLERQRKIRVTAILPGKGMNLRT
jgi:hypothetical protein